MAGQVALAWAELGPAALEVILAAAVERLAGKTEHGALHPGLATLWLLFSSPPPPVSRTFARSPAPRRPDSQ